MIPYEYEINFGVTVKITAKTEMEAKQKAVKTLRQAGLSEFTIRDVLNVKKTGCYPGCRRKHPDTPHKV